MYSRFFHAVTIAAGVVPFASGCEVAPTEPGALDSIDVQVDFCSHEIPVWFAFQNQNDPWEVVEGDAAGSFNFTATNSVGIAYVQQNGSDYHTEMVFTSNVDLDRMSGTACLEEVGSEQVNGSVAGVAGDQLALVSMNFASALLPSSQTTFSLTQLADRPLDLIGSRLQVLGTEQTATRTIIRRTLNPLDNATLPVLDFASAEAVTPTTLTASVGGIVPVDEAFLMNNFFSQLETSHTLTFIDAPMEGGQHTFVALPSSVLAAGDYHDLFVIATRTDEGVRGIERFFHAPDNQALGLGPVLNLPTVTAATTTPYVRPRAQLQAQAAYSTVVALKYFQQTQFSARNVNLSVTASYFGGTPFLWDLQIPDLSAVSGWQNAWGLTPGTFDWEVTAYLGRPELIFGARPSADETVTFATRLSSGIAIEMYRSGPRLPPRPHAFSRNHSRR